MSSQKSNFIRFLVFFSYIFNVYYLFKNINQQIKNLNTVPVSCDTGTRKAFTLVELIVTITILAILGTISFISFQGYSRDARDSIRISDIALIQKSLETYKIPVGKYPIPTETEPVLFSGSTAWTQGTVGDSVITNLANLNKIPLDPLYDTEYAYSVTNDYKEFEVGALFEGDILSSNIPLINQANANPNYTAYIKGTYNGKTIRVKAGGRDYILAVPSIISTDIAGWTLQDLINNYKLVFQGYGNLPESYKGVIADLEGGFDYQPGAIVVFSGSIENLKNTSVQVEFMQNLQAAYSGTILNNTPTYYEIANVEINPSNPSDEVLALAAMNINLNTGLDLEAPLYTSSLPPLGETSGGNTGGEETGLIPLFSLDFEETGGYVLDTGDIWTRVTTEKQEGTYSLESGNTGTHSSEYCFSADVTTPDNSYILSFYKKVSSEEGYDFLKFYINGVETGTWSGLINWSAESYSLSSGSNTLKWCYIKDSSVSENLDKVWIDNIIVSNYVDGVCGIDDGGYFYTDPVNLCNSGNVANFQDNGEGNTYTWDCNGTNGGGNVSCSANHPVFPQSILDCQTQGQTLDATTVYPGCDTNDIVLCTGTSTGLILSACNIGTNTASTDWTISRGSYFQWGRNKPFAYGDTTQETSPIDNALYDPLNDNYGFVWGSNISDWLLNRSDNLWGYTDFINGGSNNKTLLQGPCASGYHVPLREERVNILNGGNLVADGLNINQKLKLPFAGLRDYYVGGYYHGSSRGYYWLSTPNSDYNKIFYMYFTDGGSTNEWGSYVSAYGFPVRCFKNY